MFFIFLYVILLGLIFGSFVTALSFRSPKGISIAKGRSYCPKCKHQITWYDNIPVLSFILLGGKCRNCQQKISLRYPIIELATAVGFTGIYYFTFSLGIGMLILYLFSFVILESLFIIDLEHKLLPDSLIFTGISVIFLYLLLVSPNLIMSSLFAGFLAAALLMLIHLLTGGRGMGLGDVKFAVLGGMIVGLNLDLIWLFLAFLTGGMVGIILILGKRAGLKDQIAFGPFLIIGIILALFGGNSILRFMGF